MIVGLKKWNNRDETYFVQTNNPTEKVLRKLESCGPTSATMLCAAVGAHIDVVTPGGYMPQPEEVLCDYFNDPRNYAKLEAVRAGIKAADYMGNEIPQYYSVAVPAVFGVRCRYRDGLSLDNITQNLKGNVGTMVCLKIGHFVAVVAYDDATNEIIYNDPWPGNKWPKNLIGSDGYNRRVNAAEFVSHCKPFRVEIGGDR